MIVAGTIACGEKDTVSKKDRIKDIEVYDDNNELVTLQETEIVNKASTTIWLLLIGTGCIVGYDWYIAVTYIKLNRQIINILVAGIIIFLLWGWIFVFPLIACFENAIKNMIKNAFLIPISQLPYAVIIILFDIVCIGGTLYNYRTLFYGSIFWSSIGGSLLVYVNSIFMSKIFEPYR